MTEPKFTPGPWYTNHCYDMYEDDTKVFDKRGIPVADVFATIQGDSDNDGYSESGHIECEANKRLIAATPDLYGIASDLVRQCCSYCVNEPCVCVNCHIGRLRVRAKRVIAQINGKEESHE